MSANQMTLGGAFNISLENNISQVQQGNEILRNSIIESYKPFIKKVVSKVCNRFIDQTMDEFSVGLVAFNEAINQYQNGQGSKFLTFADMVIRRRIIDFIRKESRQVRHIYLDQTKPSDENTMEESFIEQQAAIDHYEEQRRIQERMEQIESYRALLLDYGITFDVLSKHCPKHADARENAKVSAKLLVEHKELVAYLKKKKQLPIKDLLQFVSCSRKTIERNRKYIIALALIYIGGFSALRSYIEPEMETVQ
ncbi:RNA polymerase sigma-I factor [Sporolactobacillus terrae]|uniref:RNA polymerase sigma factor SigI n=1 Tax=Sporolactobacillus terrae TaxID=269673 RepID=A0A410D7P4_9BACL|nr:RNA polymerase sigma-I factor [Sporolactobacillus terrae]QAA22082.1 RNA polymerase sigma-I factor [Sporolactobacillus terrae]QAA25054.1 RNA polymerase sigma-I factor [Sporolactobacillus terrae]UAK16877.1 RNA polymerase sigma-I factor [Sporolactobacillus terrae]BBN98374.1 RNA polymerase sigma factor SigI [Sporolactobacillus terrae]